MRFMFITGLLFAGVVALLPWINASLDESGLRQDAAFAPELSRSGTIISAHTVAHYLMRVARERGLELTPDNLSIEVSASRPGTLGVRGGPLKVEANQLVPIQKVSISVDYQRPIYLGLTKRMRFTIDTEAVGNGGISTYPVPTPQEAAPSDEAQAPTETEPAGDSEEAQP
jgi:hypothetical protein